MPLLRIHGVKYDVATLLEIELSNDKSPSDELISWILKLLSVWCINNEATTRSYIDLVVADVISRPEFTDLRAYGEIRCDYALDNQKKFTRADYMIGHGKGIPLSHKTPSFESHMVVMEAKQTPMDTSKDIEQLILNMAILHKERETKKCINKNVWGILSDFKSWCFGYINDEGYCKMSKIYHCDINADVILGMSNEDGFNHIKKEITNMYQALYSVVAIAYDNSPTTTPIESYMSQLLDKFSFQDK